MRLIIALHYQNTLETVYFCKLREQTFDINGALCFLMIMLIRKMGITALGTLHKIREIIPYELASLYVTWANSIASDVTPKRAASQQGLFCLLTRIYSINKMKNKNYPVGLEIKVPSFYQG